MFYSYLRILIKKLFIFLINIQLLLSLLLIFNSVLYQENFFIIIIITILSNFFWIHYTDCEFNFFIISNLLFKIMLSYLSSFYVHFLYYFWKNIRMVFLFFSTFFNRFLVFLFVFYVFVYFAYFNFQVVFHHIGYCFLLHFYLSY